MQDTIALWCYHRDADKLLFRITWWRKACNRRKLAAGESLQQEKACSRRKLVAGESGLTSAYRELREETGIGYQDIELYHMRDFTYYNLDYYVEVYAGT